MDYFERKIYSLKEFLERREKIINHIQKIENQLEIEKRKKENDINYEDKIISLKKAIQTLEDQSIDPKIKRGCNE